MDPRRSCRLRARQRHRDDLGDHPRGLLRPCRRSRAGAADPRLRARWPGGGACRLSPGLRRLQRDAVSRPPQRAQCRPPALLAQPQIPPGVCADRGDPALPAILGMAADRAEGCRGDLARLPYRPVGAARRHLFALRRPRRLGSPVPAAGQGMGRRRSNRCGGCGTHRHRRNRPRCRRHPRQQRQPSAASADAPGALRGALDRNLDHRAGAGRQHRPARSGARLPRQCRCLRPASALDTLHGGP